MTYLRGLLNESDIRQTEQSDPQRLARGFAFLAQLHLAVGESDLAADACREAVRIEPNRPEWQVQAAVLAQQMGDVESAERTLRALAESKSLTGDQLSHRAELEVQQQLLRKVEDRDFNQAKQLLRSAREAGFPQTAAVMMAVRIQAAMGDLESSEKTAQKLSEEQPTDPLVWRSLAVARHQRGNTSGALEAADRFKELTKQPVEAAVLRAGILAESKHLDRAVQELSDSVSQASADQLPKAALALSQLLNQSGRHADAIATLERAHEKAPRSLPVLEALATMNWLDQDWKGLEKCESWLRSTEGEDGTLWKSFRRSGCSPRLSLPATASFKRPSCRPMQFSASVLAGRRPTTCKVKLPIEETGSTTPWRPTTAPGNSAPGASFWRIV